MLCHGTDDAGSTAAGSLMARRLREIAAPFVAAGPAGAQVRTRLRLDPPGAGVLAALGRYLGSLAWADLARRRPPGPPPARPPAGSPRRRHPGRTVPPRPS